MIMLFDDKKNPFFRTVECSLQQSCGSDFWESFAPEPVPYPDSKFLLNIFILRPKILKSKKDYTKYFDRKADK